VQKLDLGLFDGTFDNSSNGKDSDLEFLLCPHVHENEDIFE
jgi:hypothetical protein